MIRVTLPPHLRKLAQIDGEVKLDVAGQITQRTVLDTLFSLPLVLPPTAVGVVLLDAFSRASPLGRWLAAAGIRIAFDWKGVVLATAVMSFPLLVRSARTAFEEVDPRLVEVARNLGRSSHLIENFRSIKPEWLVGVDTIALTAGASAPEILVEQAIDFLRDKGFTKLEEVEVMPENVRFGLPPEIVAAIASAPAATAGD